jgi:hypothetical protein
MRCFWCDKDFESLTDDHIVPQSLGGTLDFSVQSCKPCQTILSRAEYEVARKSTLAIHALASPLRPRHPNRPTSGHLHPLFLLVKNPLGGYGESLLSSGETMRSLAYIEAKVVPGEPIEARVRGATATDAQSLLDLYRKALKLDKKHGPGELVCEFTANLEVDPEIALDPDFWPRMVLLPGPSIMFRARTPDELLKCYKVLEFIARSDYQIDPTRWKDDVQIIGGTPHKIGLRFDPQCERRVAAKIAYALHCTVAKERLQSHDDERMRSYILGTETTPDEPVSITPDPNTWTTSSAPHFALLSPEHDRSAAFVNLYGFSFRVELGQTGILPKPAAVICEIDGSGMRLASEEDILSFTTRIRNATFSRPWIQSESGDK